MATKTAVWAGLPRSIRVALLPPSFSPSGLGVALALCRPVGEGISFALPVRKEEETAHV